MVTICTNRPEYRNDIAEELMLFLGIVETRLITPEEAEQEVKQAAKDASACQEDGQAEKAPMNVTVLLQCEMDGVSESAPQNARLMRRYRLDASVNGHALERSFALSGAAPLEIKKIEKRQIKLAVFALMRTLYPDVETPWGSLTGIRPTKLFRELTAQEGTLGARRLFLDTFSVSPEKTALAESICRVQQPLIESAQERDVDVYIGIPFCKTRCLYCSFVSEVLQAGDGLERYLAALTEDILDGAAIVRQLGYRVRAMYVGGGTPTVLSAEQLDRLLNTAFTAYGGFGCECTVEAGRPDTIDRDKLLTLKRLGVERISINPQSMNDETLRRVGRAHTVLQTVEAFELARTVGFAHINMDVIAGLPGETMDDMRRTYDALLPLSPENLTVHTLAVKRSSLLKSKLADYPLPDAQDVAQMVDDGAAAACKMGMEPYYMYRQKYMRGNLENVGYAKPGHICVYNVDMMEESVSILSHGAGSMTKRVYPGEHRIERLPSPKDVQTYVGKLAVLKERKRRFFAESAAERILPNRRV